MIVIVMIYGSGYAGLGVTVFRVFLKYGLSVVLLCSSISSRTVSAELIEIAVCWESLDFASSPSKGSGYQQIIIRDADGNAIASARPSVKQCERQKYYYMVGCQNVAVPKNPIGYILEVSGKQTSVIDADKVTKYGAMTIQTVTDSLAGEVQTLYVFTPMCE